MPKRNAKDLEPKLEEEEPRRSSRRKSTKDSAIPEKAIETSSAKKSGKKSGKKLSSKEEKRVDEEDVKDLTPKPTKKPTPSTSKATPSTPFTGRQYWLMKAEPESRLEKGHDIKFSIDDLAAKTEPEPWDGIRAYPARNNLRAMKKGDLAFFYHSSCKVPAIVGIMEIVAEHSPDLTAHDASAPYYDASSSPSNPKWSVVHVVFKQKLKDPITLKDLRAFAEEKESPLREMQILRLTRLSVSRVSGEEWGFLRGVMAERGEDVGGF